MNYKITVKSLNKIFTIKNKAIRSPFETFVTEDELKLIKSRMKFYGLTERDLIIENLTENEDQKKDYSYIEEQKPQLSRVEDIKKSEENNSEKPDSTKIIDSIQPIQKNIIKDEKRTYKIQQRKPTKKILTKSKEKTEQTINESDVEVKIEELSIKASSLLEKFLHSEI